MSEIHDVVDEVTQLRGIMEVLSGAAI